MDDTAVCDSEPAGSNILLDTVAMTTKGDSEPAGSNASLDTVAMTTHIPVVPPSSKSQGFACPFFGTMDDTAVCDSEPAGSNALLDTCMTTEGHACMGCESAEVGGKVTAKDEVLLMISKQDQDTSCKGHDRRTARPISSECSQQVESIGMKNVPQSKKSNTEGVPFERPMSNDVEVPGRCSAGGHMDDLEHGKENSADARCTCDSVIESSSICKIEVETALPSRGADVSTKPLEGFSSILDTSNRENTGKAARETPCFLARNNCGSCGESANKNNCHCGVAESTQEEIEMGNSLNDSESSWALSLSPKAVIQALGQLRFWKARFALIRQQRIFTDQVFELHKLIEVQRLLAGSPYTSLDEIYFGVGHMNLECDADALASHSRLVDKKENVGDALGKQIVVSTNTKSINSRAHLEQSSAVPGVVEGGVGVWGYPGLGGTESLSAQSLEEHNTRMSSGGAKDCQGHVLKVVPRAAVLAPESAAGILLSIQQERKPQL